MSTFHRFDCRCPEHLPPLAVDPVAEAVKRERERIAQAIEELPLDAWGSQAPRGAVTFARAEAYIRCAAIARAGGAS